MEKIKHTPGPWVFNENECLPRVFDRDGKPIALHCRRKTPGEANANARLIASAPEMLTLLRRSAERLQSYCEEVDGDMNDDLAMEIYKLIEKLEG